ncbi:MAG: non-ribosomal peptide synthetase, partial [Kangiellaceae bacterium]
MTIEHQSTDVYHLSNLPKNQLWFWIGQNLEHDTPFFNMPMALTIQGEVEHSRFAHAFQQVVNRADALRTIIKVNQGVPQRVVLEQLDYQVEYLDFSDQADPKQAFDNWATPRCQQIFDLEKCLFDSVLVKLSDTETMWYWCQHHLICDGWSTALVYRYVSEFYEKSFNENIEELPHFPSFEGYAAREQEYRESKAHQQSKEYWEKVLSEPLDTLNFYGKTARDHGVNKAIRMTRDLGEQRTNAIKALCKQKPFKSLSSHLSTFQLISTCLLAYLYRITGNEDLALGTLYHNRATQDDKNTVGFFMETAPLRVSATSEDTFETLYSKTKRTSMEVMRHYRYAPGNPMNNRAYDVAINYNNASYPPFAGMPMSLHWLHTGAWYSHEPLAIQIHDFDGTGTFTIAFDFNVGVFDEETRERAIQHFFKCIDAIIENPAGSIADFNILTDKENELIKGVFKAQDGFEIPDVCLHELFEKQAKITPHNVAVYNQEVSYTYQELFLRVEKLSAYLRLQGVQLDSPVGLSMSKHPDMIVAMLAILKSGGGYVPLDPAYPNDRLNYMIKDSKIQFLLTQQELLDDLPEHDCKVVTLDSDWNDIVNTNLDDPTLANLNQPSPSNLAYVIYTSGSTGDAKGVMIEHQSIVNYTIAAKDAFGFCEEDKVLQFASISFDTAGEEIYPTLISGGTLCLVDDSMLGSAKDFLNACEREKITFLDLPTAFWHQITASIIEDKLALPASIRNVIIGGERAQPQAVANWIESVKSNHSEDSGKENAKLINTYGPTECTIVSSYCELNTKNTNRDQEAPIGLPVKNLYAYVLDKNMQPVALGVTGELHMGGVGLARGYLGKPEMTDEKFIQDPFSNNIASKLYKTG